MSKPLRDVNEQTGIDMQKARAGSTLAVENVRDFLYREWGLEYLSFPGLDSFCCCIDGRQEWLTRSRIVSLLERDPVFNKSTRYIYPLILQASNELRSGIETLWTGPRNTIGVLHWQTVSMSYRTFTIGVITKPKSRLPSLMTSYPLGFTTSVSSLIWLTGSPLKLHHE